MKLQAYACRKNDHISKVWPFANSTPPAEKSLIHCCSQRRFHNLFILIQKSTCKVPKHFLARILIQKVQLSAFVLTWEMLFCPQTTHKCCNRRATVRATDWFQNGACADVTKVTWLKWQLLTTECRRIGFGLFNCNYTILDRNFTKRLIPVNKLPHYLLFYFRNKKNAFIIKLTSKFTIDMIRESLRFRGNSPFKPQPPKITRTSCSKVKTQ